MNVNKAFWLWIRSFLGGRRQQVKLARTLLSVKPCPAGVPQGSVMSPELFNIHNNDIGNSISDRLSINTCKYADDCTQGEVVPLRHVATGGGGGGGVSHMLESWSK